MKVEFKAPLMKGESNRPTSTTILANRDVYILWRRVRKRYEYNCSISKGNGGIMERCVPVEKAGEEIVEGRAKGNRNVNVNANMSTGT